MSQVVAGFFTVCKTTQRVALSIVLVALTTSGCSANAQLEEPGKRQENLYVLSTALWSPGETIPVCWSDPSSIANASDRNGVRRAALSWATYANIKFSGWSDSCPASGFTGVKILPNTGNTYKVSFLGKPSSGFNTMHIGLEDDLENLVDRCEDGAVPDREDCIMIYARHEWGHALGFSHEQNRPDADCHAKVQGPNGDTLLGGPDYYSVMSYCGKQHSLTLGDISGSVQVYGLALPLQASLF